VRDPVNEANWIADQVEDLVAKRGLKYSDIGLITRSARGYLVVKNRSIDRIETKTTIGLEMMVRFQLEYVRSTNTKLWIVPKYQLVRLPMSLLLSLTRARSEISVAVKSCARLSVLIDFFRVYVTV
jgi:hypothetical protein